MDYLVSNGDDTWHEYKPFEGGMPYQVYEKQEHKCEYCGKPDYHANCHAHKDWCPYYCGGEPIGSAPLGGGLAILITIAFAYYAYKLFAKKVNKL